MRPAPSAPLLAPLPEPLLALAPLLVRLPWELLGGRVAVVDAARVAAAWMAAWDAAAWDAAAWAAAWLTALVAGGTAAVPVVPAVPEVPVDKARAGALGRAAPNSGVLNDRSEAGSEAEAGGWR